MWIMREYNVKYKTSDMKHSKKLKGIDFVQIEA